MGKIEVYQHHGTPVFVDEELKGKHREHCLCFRGCVRFKPGMPENCPIAQDTFENCVKHDIVTPMYECPEYEEGA